jgi:phosphoribosylamine--glycine ligase
MASRGYPGPYEAGKPIDGLDATAGMEQVEVFHAGTAMGPEGVVTSGGRVLGITALGDSLQESRDRAYEVAALISFDGAQMRGDIGMKTSDR